MGRQEAVDLPTTILTLPGNESYYVAPESVAMVVPEDRFLRLGFEGTMTNGANCWVDVAGKWLR